MNMNLTLNDINDKIDAFLKLDFINNFYLLIYLFIFIYFIIFVFNEYKWYFGIFLKYKKKNLYFLLEETIDFESIVDLFKNNPPLFLLKIKFYSQLNNDVANTMQDRIQFYISKLILDKENNLVLNKVNNLDSQIFKLNILSLKLNRFFLDEDFFKSMKLPHFKLREIYYAYCNLQIKLFKYNKLVINLKKNKIKYNIYLTILNSNLIENNNYQIEYNNLSKNLEILNNSLKISDPLLWKKNFLLEFDDIIDYWLKISYIEDLPSDDIIIPESIVKTYYRKFSLIYYNSFFFKKIYVLKYKFFLFIKNNSIKFLVFFLPKIKTILKFLEIIK